MGNDSVPDPGPRHTTLLVQRLGTAGIGLAVWALGVLMFTGHTSFTSRHGVVVFGLTGNGLLATISVVVGAILLVAALRGGTAVSTTAAIVGGLFLFNGLLGLGLLRGGPNILAFTLADVLFSLVVGMLLLSIGLPGRVGGPVPARR